MKMNKAPVEQAGGDERAAFEQWLEQHMSHHFSPEFDLAKYEDSGEYRYNPAADYWKAWQARADLAHRAPEVCSECSDTGKVYDESGDGPWSCYACTGNPEVIGYANGDELDNMLDDRTAVLSPGKTSFHTVPVYRLIRADLAQPSPAQAEAERPEVVAYLFVKPDGTLSMDAVRHKPSQPAVAVMTVAQHERIVGELRADRDSWAEQAEQRLADWDEMRKERDAALARVAELERQEPVALANRGLHAFWVKWTEAAAGLYGPGIKLYAAPVVQAQQLHDLDKQCRDDVARALGLRPNQERGFAWSYLLASIKSCVKASEDSAQAQHSVPAYVSYTTQPAESLAGIALRQLKDESRWVEIRDINAHAFPDMRSHSYYPAGTVIKLPAAAPGKEGV
ncbi:TPA: LysM peptidoglycan-binding domain-containing protein [Pseudomonas aeruginosa]